MKISNEDINRLIHLFDDGTDGGGSGVTFLMHSGGYAYEDALEVANFIIIALIKQKRRIPSIQCPCCGSHVEYDWPVCRKCGQTLDWQGYT